ncbi:hypothetical protein IF1G_05985 [Cordyceps javanica]|uniref:Uncharacterized protein n=1 Tax=Cordyceps javanica TaxID=43265 RepID=A0A545UZW3_9HYPO|nr:hypothetical protein IF1G_05985 [Cordyceps javanica]
MKNMSFFDTACYVSQSRTCAGQGTQRIYALHATYTIRFIRVKRDSLSAVICRLYYGPEPDVCKRRAVTGVQCHSRPCNYSMQNHLDKLFYLTIHAFLISF